jgi:hypothetical protein
MRVTSRRQNARDISALVDALAAQIGIEIAALFKLVELGTPAWAALGCKVRERFPPRKMGFSGLSGVRHARPRIKAGEQHGENAS